VTFQQFGVRRVSVCGRPLFRAEDADCSLDVAILDLGRDCGGQQLVGVPLLSTRRC